MIKEKNKNRKFVMRKYVTNSDFIMQFNWHKLTMLEIVILFT